MATLNIGSKSDDWRAHRLSNFSDDAFVLDGVRCASAEGFIQGVKFPEGCAIRTRAFAAVGVVAKKLGRGAEGRSVWWNNKTLAYGSAAHHELIERAIRAKFDQNPEAMEALRATDGLRLTHDLGRPESPKTSLPALVFCDILTRIRTENLSHE